MFEFIRILLWVMLFGSALLMSVVILLQESKGGGLAEAFGGVGAETFGVIVGLFVSSSNNSRYGLSLTT